MDGAYVINLDEFKSIIYFVSFEVEHIPKEIKTSIEIKNITKIYRIQAYNSIMCGYFCIRFIDFMSKSLYC